MIDQTACQSASTRVLATEDLSRARANCCGQGAMHVVKAVGTGNNHH
jgi:hypothetical protein